MNTTDGQRELTDAELTEFAEIIERWVRECQAIERVSA